MPFHKEKKDILELQFEKPNINFLVEEDADALKLYSLIKRLDFSEFYKRYSHAGAVAYKPEILFAIYMLAISEGVLSTRAIEKKCKRDIYYIYITEYRKPDHSTIARYLQKFKKEIFGLLPQLVRLAKENNVSSFKSIAIDGSKFQASSSIKHSMKMKDLEQEEKQLAREIQKLFHLVQENDKKEARDERKTKNLLAQKEKLENRRKQIEESKIELKKRQELIKEKDHRERHQINIEEPDARMMTEISANGYNIQLAVDTKSDMVVNVSVETARSDNNQFSKQHHKAEEILGKDSEREYLADGGYVSTETMDYVEENKVNAYINDSREKEKIPTVEELLERGKKIISEFFVFDKEQNEYTCPDQRKLKEIKPGIYESENCEGCILFDLCAQKTKRRINRTEFTERKELMRKKIKQSPGKMNERKAVERVFGNIKWNLGFRRFTRKGINGAAIETMMFVLAINLRKMANFLLIFRKMYLAKFYRLVYYNCAVIR